VPAAVDVQVVVVPLAGAQVAPWPADQVGAKPERPLANASVPVAVNPWLPPATMVAVAGSSVTLARSDATTVIVAVALIVPLDAVMV
jgi:phage-related tail fiber protein